MWSVRNYFLKNRLLFFADKGRTQFVCLLKFYFALLSLLSLDTFAFFLIPSVGLRDFLFTWFAKISYDYKDNI